jgi:hypothetical protein
MRRKCAEIARKDFLERAILLVLQLRPYRYENCDERFFGGYLNKHAHIGPKDNKRVLSSNATFGR